MPQWFKRFADVPGLEYRPNPGVHSEHLPLHNAHPRITYYDYENQRRESYFWPTSNPNQETSRAPAANWETKPLPGEPPTYTVLRQLWERLELPGGLSDYHFAIQECCRELRQPEYTKPNPEVLNEIEQLCWLDIRLVETYPAIITNQYKGQTTYFPGTCYQVLISLYEREGYLQEALSVAERQARFAADTDGVLRRLREKIAALEAEESPDGN